MTATVRRAFVAWIGIVAVDLVLTAALSPSDTAGYLSLAGAVAVVGWTWLRTSEQDARVEPGVSGD